MWKYGARFLVWSSPLLLAALNGCAWPQWMHTEQKPAQPPPANPSPHTGGFGAEWRGPPPGPGQGPPGPGAGAPGPFNEHVALMSQRLTLTEDDKKVLQTRVRQLELQLRDKDRALMQASFEIQEATGQIARTREEVNRWKQEMEALRGKLRGVENDNKATLEAIIRTLEQFLDREKTGQPEPLVLTPGK